MRARHDSRNDNSPWSALLVRGLPLLMMIAMAATPSAKADDSNRSAKADDSTVSETVGDSLHTHIELRRTLDGRYVADEQVVRARRPDAQARADRSSRSVTILELDEVDAATQTLGDLLRSATGVSIRESGGVGGSATISLRGSSSQQVPVFLDGVPLNDPVNGGVDLASIPLQSISSVEVYRGAAPLVLGNSSLGGAVHLYTHRGRHPHGLAVSQGSYGHLQFDAKSATRLGDWVLDLRARALRNDGDWEFLDDRGTPYNPRDDRRVRRANNRIEGGGFLVHAIRPSAGWSFRAQLLGDRRDQGTPGYAVRQSLEATSGSWATQARLEAVAPSNTAWWREVSVFYREEGQTFEDPRGDFGGRAADRSDRTRRVGARLLAGWRSSRDPALGLTFEHTWLNSVDHLADDLGRGHQRRLSVAAAFEPRLRRGRWSLEPGVRLEFSQDSLQDRVRRSALDSAVVPELRQWSPTARLGLRWQATPTLALRTSLGRSERVPTLLERFGDRGTVVGNPELGPERGTQREVGLVYHPAAGRRFALAYFDNSARDLITYEANSPVSTRPVNVGRASMRGVEVEADFGRYGPFDTRLVMTRMTSLDRSDRRYAAGAPLPGRPGLELTVEQGLRVAGARVTATLRGVGDNYLQTGERERVPSRTVVDLQTRVPIGASLMAVATLHNATDVEAFDLWNFPLPGRHFEVSLRWSGSNGTP